MGLYMKKKNGIFVVKIYAQQMKFKTILYSNHAVKQMFQRSISIEEVEYALQNGEIIMEYKEDKPYPSSLLLAFYKKRPLHVVSSFNVMDKTTIVITAYEPSLDIWENDFKSRKN